MPVRRRRGDKGRDASVQTALCLLASAERTDDELVAAVYLETALKRNPKSKKFGPRGPYNRPKDEVFYSLLLHGFADRFFTRWVRMSRRSFWYLHRCIADDPVFVSSGRRPQRPVSHQLATFLVKWGEYGGVKTASVVGIAEGSVYNYCRRVITAIRNIKEKHLWWPGPERRRNLKEAMASYGFPGCIGIVDGSLLKLDDHPREDPYSYYSRKQFYALAIQATTDHLARFTSYVLGWPGSVADTMMYNRSPLCINSQDFFADDEYVLADKGYPILPTTIRPFSEPELRLMTPERRDERRAWNVALSRLRIKVEHAFGILKGRFPILRSIPNYDLIETYQAIEALMVIHNILITEGDDPFDIEGFVGEEDEAAVEMRNANNANNGGAAAANARRVGVDVLRQRGLARRLVLIDYWRDNVR